MRPLLALTALAATVAAAIAASTQTPTPPRLSTPRPRLTATPAPARTPPPPRVDRAAINRQDQTGARHRAREARAYESRPLLTRLPLTRAGVRIDIAGLAADDRTAVLAIDPGARSRAHAHAVYRHALRHAGDRGDAYLLEWTR